jgi:hypothetical protein
MKEEGEIKPLDEKDCFLYFSEQIEVAIRVKSNSHSQRKFQNRSYGHCHATIIKLE